MSGMSKQWRKDLSGCDKMPKNNIEHFSRQVHVGRLVVYGIVHMVIFFGNLVWLCKEKE